jgi:hypothetical protein
MPDRFRCHAVLECNRSHDRRIPRGHINRRAALAAIEKHLSQATVLEPANAGSVAEATMLKLNSSWPRRSARRWRIIGRALGDASEYANTPLLSKLISWTVQWLSAAAQRGCYRVCYHCSPNPGFARHFSGRDLGSSTRTAKRDAALRTEARRHSGMGVPTLRYG